LLLIAVGSATTVALHAQLPPACTSARAGLDLGAKPFRQLEQVPANQGEA
jgi:hypothetical protein